MYVCMRLPKAMLWGEMDGGVRRQGRPTKTWWDGVKGDLKELGLVLHWRKLCQNREKWGKSIKPIKRKATKGELATGRATKAELRSQGSRASGRLRERSGQSVPEATKESEHDRGQPARARRHQQGHRGRHAQD